MVRSRGRERALRARICEGREACAGSGAAGHTAATESAPLCAARAPRIGPQKRSRTRRTPSRRARARNPTGRAAASPRSRPRTDTPDASRAPRGASRRKDRSRGSRPGRVGRGRSASRSRSPRRESSLDSAAAAGSAARASDPRRCRAAYGTRCRRGALRDPRSSFAAGYLAASPARKRKHLSTPSGTPDSTPARAVRVPRGPDSASSRARFRPRENGLKTVQRNNLQRFFWLQKIKR